jgi:hypothetical protein
MKIEHLLKSINEAGPRTAAQQASMQAAANGPLDPADNTIPFPTQSGTSQTAPAATTQTAPTAASTTQPAAGPTGDPTLDQPLPPGAPKKTLAQKVGGFAKGVGAVAGGVAGIGRAVKKGYAAGANAVGGPGAPSAAPSTSSAPGLLGQTAGGGAPSSSGGGSGPGVSDQEFNQLVSRIQKLEQLAQQYQRRP